MEENKYKLAGWAAFGSAFTFLITTGILLYHDIRYTPAIEGGGGSDPTTVFLALAVNVISTGLAIYALLRFRRLLHERYDFHAVDNLILVLIVGGVIIGGIAYAGRLVDKSLPFVFMIVLAGIAMGAIGIIFALRLLKVPGNLNGYLKPLAYTQLIASICFALVFLAPIGLIMMVVFNVLLGVVFLSSDGSLEEVDFV